MTTPAESLFGRSRCECGHTSSYHDIGGCHAPVGTALESDCSCPGFKPATPGLSENRILVELRADDFAGGYVAAVVGLTGCVSQGDTVGEALRNIAEAYEGVRDTLIALDQELS